MKEDIDKILFEVHSNNNAKILEEDDFDDYSEFIEYRKTINSMLDDYRVIKKPLTNTLDVILTKFGEEVVNQGGWFKYLENEKLKEQFDRDKINIELENLKSSTEVNRFLLKTKWLPHIVAVISLLFSIYIYFDAINDSRKLEKRIETLEKIAKKTK